MPGKTDRSTRPQPSDWSLLALCLAWSVAQGSLLQAPDGAASSETLGDAVFLAGAAASIAAHELVRAAFDRHRARLDRSAAPASSPAGRRGWRAEIAGAVLAPAANLSLGGGAFLVARLVYLGGGPDAVVRGLAAVVTLNVVLTATLLVPALPMDGGRLLHAVLRAASGRPELAARAAAVATETVGWLLLVAGLATVLAYGASAAFLWLLTAALVVRAGRAERRRLAGLHAPADAGPDPSASSYERLRPHVI